MPILVIFSLSSINCSKPLRTASMTGYPPMKDISTLGSPTVSEERISE